MIRFPTPHPDNVFTLCLNVPYQILAFYHHSNTDNCHWKLSVHLEGLTLFVIEVLLTMGGGSNLALVS